MRRAAAALGLCALAVNAEEWVKPAVQGPLERLVYDYEVASYCGLADAAATREYRRAFELLAAGRERAERDAARANAWKAAHWEWQNRGLGGYRAWCRDEGATAARRLRGEPSATPPGAD